MAESVCLISLLCCRRLVAGIGAGMERVNLRDLGGVMRKDRSGLGLRMLVDLWARILRHLLGEVAREINGGIP